MLAPSEHLKQSLTELQLCTPQQLLACEPEVRRLTGDLPGFDSCWLDVLVAHRLLTPWQAEQLQSEDPLWMRQGRYRLREPLGCRTWQAETLDRSRLVVLSRLTQSDQRETDLLVARVRSQMETVDAARTDVPSSICLPREYLPDANGDGGWVVSSWVPGWQLDELLIRGGRMPWQVVVETGRAILNGVNGLQRHDLNHGDISLRNIRLQPNGQAVLVDPFTARWLKPSIGFRADLRLRDVQHCAPELAGGGRSHHAVSDLYSLGTVLWQMLTARPTFLSADPVTFLMQCRERDVEDVREWVPDCPDHVAQQIQQLTRRRPELRPQSFAAALEIWNELPGHTSTATRRLLRRLPDRGHVSVAPQPTLNRRRRLHGGWAAVAVTSCVMIGLSCGLVPLPLNLRRTKTIDTVPNRSEASAEVQALHPEPTGGPLPLPQPSADGDIQLTAGQLYVARALEQPGTLRIQCTGTDLAMVEVPENSAWKVSADQVLVSGVQIFSRRDPSANRQPLLDVSSRVLELDRVIVGDGTAHRAAGLRWSSLVSGSTILRVMNSVFLSGRYAIQTTSAPGHFVLRNVLFEAAETAWRCDIDNTPRVPLNMSQVTQRNGRSFADMIRGKSSPPAPLHLDIVCGDSVVAPTQALVRLASTDAQWAPTEETIAFRLASGANPTIMLPSVTPVVWFDRSLKQNVALPESQILLESFLMAEPQFDSGAPASHSFATARLVDFDGPKRGQQLPGVNIDLLPGLPEPAVDARAD